jgi:hypothetical protein
MDTKLEDRQKEGEVVFEETDDGVKRKRRVVSRKYRSTKDIRISEMESQCLTAITKMRDSHHYNQLDLDNRSTAAVSASVINWYSKNYTHIYPPEYEELSDSDSDNEDHSTSTKVKKIILTKDSKVVNNISFADRLKGIK